MAKSARVAATSAMRSTSDPRQAGERHAEHVPQRAEDEADDQRVADEVEAEAAEERAGSRLGMGDAVAALGADDEDSARRHHHGEVDGNDQRHRHRSGIAVGGERQRDADQHGVAVGCRDAGDDAGPCVAAEEAADGLVADHPHQCEDREIGDPQPPGRGAVEDGGGERPEDEHGNRDDEDEIGESLAGLAPEHA